MSTFKFKQFQVIQSQSGAKITTDATVFAASLSLPEQKSRLLEIGAGTGVISLMLAQRFPLLQVSAIEIEPAAAREAKANFAASPFNCRLRLVEGDVRDFVDVLKYDCIVSNPPFFKDHLKSEINPKKNKAYHTESLELKELAESIDKNLTPSGIAFLMLPPYEASVMKSNMEDLGFSCTAQLALQHTSRTPIVRYFLAFERNKGVRRHFVIPENEICIRNDDNTFSELYQNLMTPFLKIF